MVVGKICDIKYMGIELVYELPVIFKFGNYDFFIEIRYKENPSSCGYRGWREL
jgi:hypothetical protein